MQLPDNERRHLDGMYTLTSSDMYFGLVPGSVADLVLNSLLYGQPVKETKGSEVYSTLGVLRVIQAAIY